MGEDTADSDIYDEGDNTHTYCFNEVNYGELSFLDDLKRNGIAYDHTWHAGNDYEAGTESLRFESDGTPVMWCIYDVHLNPDIHSCLELIDDPEALREYLLKHKENTTVSIDLDEEQVERGKLYRARALITQ